MTSDQPGDDGGALARANQGTAFRGVFGWKGGALAARITAVKEAFGRGTATILACALIATLPLAIRGNSCGHDFDFHLQSWMSVAQHWSHGTLYPHWLEAANYGAGEPRFVFYPPLTWMLGALLGIVFPWATAPAVFTLLVLAASGLSMEKLAREYLPQSAAITASCAYILSPYTLFLGYERAAYGELAAAIWLPLLVLYALGTRDQSATSRNTIVILSEAAARSEGAESKDLDARGSAMIASKPGLSLPKDLASEIWVSSRKTILCLALTVAAIWLTNAPAAVMACYLLAAISLWTCLSRRSVKPVLHNTAGLLLGLGLACLYLVPAAWERRWVEIDRAIGPGMRIGDSFLFAHTGAAFHDQVLRTASWIVVVMLASIAVAGLAAWRYRRYSRLLVSLLVTSAVLFGLQFPWSRLLWDHAPELKFLQFPWRLSLVLSLVFAIAVGAAFSRQATAKLSRVQTALLLMAAIAASAGAAKLFWQPCDEEDAVNAQLTVFLSGNGIEGTDEYATLGADNSLIAQYQPPIRVLRAADAETAIAVDEANPPYTPTPREEIAANIEIDPWLPEHKLATIQSPVAAYAILRLIDYPAWRIRANHRLVARRPHRADGLAVIPLQPGTTQVEIDYAATGDVLIGRALSAASLLALVLLAVSARKRIARQIS